MPTPSQDRDAYLVDEPFVDMGDIQGNILHGFNKSHQALLGVKITDAGATRTWLRSIHSQITTALEVDLFRKLRNMMLARLGAEPTELAVTWTNIAFSSAGLRTLARRPQDVDEFEDEAFQLGLAKRSSSLGDPNDAEDQPGSPRNWKVGGKPENTPDLLLLVAADRPGDLATKVDWFKRGIDGSSGLNCFYDERGDDLPGHLAGHEHFGFKDAISQPGIRGRNQNPPHEFITPRLIDAGDSLARSFAAPGQPLIRPGQFVFGYDTQDAFTGGIGRPRGCPTWARGGAFLVYRRLRQDVSRFWKFMEQTAADLSRHSGLEGLKAEQLAAMLVGRWPSGAPVMRTPGADNPALAADQLNNHFQFNNASRIIPFDPSSGLRPDTSHLAPADFDGVFCQRAGHIRKVNPRDLSTEQLGGRGDTLTRRILRRGIPFGTVMPDRSDPASDPLKGDRGLLFLCYQTSITDQFEFLSTNWMNQEIAPEGNGGFDLIVGQNNGNAAGSPRVRRCPFRFKVGGAPTSEEIRVEGDWVVPSGGGYFFSPSLSALREELS